MYTFDDLDERDELLEMEEIPEVEPLSMKKNKSSFY